MSVDWGTWKFDVSACQSKVHNIKEYGSKKEISWHEWFNLICVNIGYPDQTRHLKCSS